MRILLSNVNRKLSGGTAGRRVEFKGRPDPLEQVKAAAAQRWAAAVNAEGSFGRWGYTTVRNPSNTHEVIDAFLGELAGTA